MKWRTRYHAHDRKNKGGGTVAGFRDVHSLEDAVRGVKTINERVRRDRKKAGKAAREAHLRALMGLPPLLYRDDGEG